MFRHRFATSVSCQTSSIVKLCAEIIRNAPQSSHEQYILGCYTTVMLYHYFGRKNSYRVANVFQAANSYQLHTKLDHS